MAYYIRGREQTIGQLLGADFAYRIPGYQRPYAWDQEDAVQLLDDLASSLQRGRQSSPHGGHYYLGNIVVSRPEGSPVASIVDGQQRLITLTILLALLRDRGGSTREIAARAIFDERGSPRVMPREQDAAFLLEFAQEPGATMRTPVGLAAGNASELATDEADDARDEDNDAVDSAEDEDEDDGEDEGEEDNDDEEDNDEDEDETEDDAEQDDDLDPSALAPIHDSRRAILDNRDAMRTRLDALLSTGRLTAEELTRFLLERCYVVRVQVGNNADAHRVFIVMHSRGKRLSETDILKSEVLGAISDPADLAVCQRIWEDGEVRLGRKGFELLFGHLRMLALKAAPRKAIFAELRDAYAPEAAPGDFVRGVLSPAVDLYEAILGGSWQCRRGSAAQVAEINRRLVRLGLLPHGSWPAVAMRLLARHGEDAGILLDLIRKLDALAYGLYLIEPREERIRRYAAVLRAIDDGRTASDLCAGELALDREEAGQLAVMLTKGSLRSSAMKRVVLLRRLDSEQLPGDGPLPDYADTNVEHVLPRSPEPGGNWLTWFPNPKDYLQSFGNLIVIPSADNRRLGNEEYEIKRHGNASMRGYAQIHAEHGYGLIPEILAIAEWKPEIVSARQRRFEDLLLGLWQLERPTETTRKAAARRRKKKKAQARRRKAKQAASPPASPTAVKRKRRRKRRQTSTPPQ